MTEITCPKCGDVQNVTLVATEAMLDAGFKVFEESGIAEWPMEGPDKLVIAEIYQAMIAAACPPESADVES